jgi:hypothetical protein
MTKENIKDLRTKIIQGVDLAYNRLLSSKIKEDGELVITKDGKVIRIKAKELSK